MRGLLKHHPSRPMAVALLALVLALTGTAVAASRLVSGDKLIKKGSLSGNRMRKHTLTGTQINMDQLGKVPSAVQADSANTANSATNATNAVNATNATNATNAANATNATNAMNATNATSAATASSLATLPGGKSESGAFSNGGGSSASGFLGVSISYPQPLAAPIPDANVIWGAPGANPNCPALGQAAPGFLCLYNFGSSNVTFLVARSDDAGFGATPSPGAAVFWNVTAANNFVEGSWTVTAPPGSAAKGIARPQARPRNRP